jgi:hypothetical protein
MNESLFIDYVKKFFPKLQRFIDKINGKRGDLTYLHKDTTILRKEYSPDNKWESGSVNTTFVAADYVAVDSELPLKSRDSIASANGKLPKIGIQKVLKESDINSLNVMKAQGATGETLATKLAQDPVACDRGLDERNEFNFLYGLSNGCCAIQDEDNPDAVLRLNFNYMPEHCFGASTPNEITIADLRNVIEKADSDGNTITKIWIAKSTHAKLRQSREAKELVANYNGQVFTDSTNLAVPTATKFNEAFADEFGGVQFQIVDRSIQIEKNGKRQSVKPWNANKVIFVCNDMVGALVYGRLAEQSNPVANVDYQLIDNYKLISKYSLVNPLREVTSGQAFVAPIIEDVDQLYSLDISEAQEIDETSLVDDTDDYIIVWGEKYTKSAFITTMKELGISVKANATDATIIKAINALSDADEAKLKSAVEPHKA